MKKVLLVVGFLILISNVSYSQNYNIICEDYYYVDGGKGKESKSFDGAKEYISLNLNDETITWEKYIHSNGEIQNINETYKFTILKNEIIYVKAKYYDQYTWEAEYNFIKKNLKNTNYFKHTKKIQNIIYAKKCNDVNNLKLAIVEGVQKTPPSNNKDDRNKNLGSIVAASSGTGFFVSTNGHMVTNNHVIEGCDNVQAHYKGKIVDTDVLFVDRTNDLAIIKANIKPEKVFPVSNEDVSLLEDIIVAGYPLGKNISSSIKTFKGSVTALAGFGDNYSNFQIDASLSSGNSGGPIINQKGNVVGVAVEKLVEVGVEGFNFGVKSSTLKTFASSNQIKFEPASTEELSNKELGQLITEATIYLECWMSVAKIKQIIQEGERQKAFFSEYK